MNPRLRSAGVLLFWLTFVALAGGACTMIAFNRGPVALHESDSHDAGTNSHTFDVNLSPR